MQLIEQNVSAAGFFPSRNEFPAVNSIGEHKKGFCHAPFTITIPNKINNTARPQTQTKRRLITKATTIDFNLKSGELNSTSITYQ